MRTVVFISERSEFELIGDNYAEVGKFREMQCPEYEYRHWCTKVSPGVQITPGGWSEYREKC